MSLLSFLKKTLRIGEVAVPAIIGAYNPLLGQLIGQVLQAVVPVEALVAGKGQGTLKADIAQALLTSKAADIEALFQAAGKPIHNPELFAAAVATLQDAVVGVLNSTGDRTKPATPIGGLTPLAT